MNANDNFEKTDLPLDGNDLNNSNVTPTRDTDIEESNNQNKEKIEISETETTPQSLDQEVVQPLSKIEDAEKVEDKPPNSQSPEHRRELSTKSR